MTRKIKIGFLIVLIVLFGGAGYANSNIIDLYLKQVNLPGDAEPSSINTILTDSFGFVWLGTKEGLFRWDGIFATKFSIEKNNNSKNVTALSEDAKGNIWIGCDDGSICYITDREIIIWKEGDTASFQKINDILVDESDRVWWGTNGSGLFYFDGSKTVSISTKDGLPDNYIYKLEKGIFNEIWASTDRGVAVCKSWEGINEVIVYGSKDGLNDDIVTTLKKDISNNIWFGFHEGGICFYNQEDKSFNNLAESVDFSFGTINHLETDQSGIWITDEQKGLLYIDLDGNNTINKVRFSGDNLPRKIKLVRTDKMGNLWVLGKEGLYVTSGGAFSKLSELWNYPLSEINTLAISNTNEIWIAEGNIIRNLSESSSEVVLDNFLSQSAKITDLKFDDDGLLWIATFGQGVAIFDKTTKKYRFITEESDGLVNNNVLGISIKGNHVWLATLGGASHLVSSSDWYTKAFKIESFDKEHGLGNNFIYQILQDRAGNIWFGTDGNGLAKYNSNGFTFYDEESGLDDDVVYSIDEDDEGNIWLSTASSGIYMFNGNVFQHFDRNEGLTDNNIFSIACQGDYVFVLSVSGLDIIERSTGIITGLNEEIGIRKLSASLNCVTKKENNIIFPTNEGFISVDIRRLEGFNLQPQTIVDRVTVNLDPVTDTNDLIFTSHQNQLVFEYSGHWYLAPGKVQYVTRLNGYNYDWNTTYDRRASFASLSPGKYTFEVAAFLNHQLNSPSRQHVSFNILKPYYLTWWFILLMVIVFLGFLFVLIKFRENRLKISEARKKEKLEFEFQTLKNQINPHFLFNSFSTLISMIEDNPRQAVEYTDKLSDFFRNILEVKDTELISVKEELNMLQNYYFIQHKRFGNNFTLNISLDEGIFETMIPPLTFQLLTENAIKHNIISKNKPLTVNISNDGTSITVSNDLQPKKNPESSTGLGLLNIRERYRVITGTIVKVENLEKQFKVILPIINKAI